MKPSNLYDQIAIKHLKLIIAGILFMLLFFGILLFISKGGLVLYALFFLNLVWLIPFCISTPIFLFEIMSKKNISIKNLFLIIGLVYLLGILVFINYIWIR